MKISNNLEQSNDVKVTKNDLKKMFLRGLALEYSWNYERQQNMGYCYAMLPIIKKLYKKKEEQIEAVKRHMEFFNTTPYVSTLVLGISTAMEESNANNEDFDTSSISSVKASLMSPLAGIGDSLFWGTLRVIATGVGTSLSLQGNILGPILFLLLFNIPQFIVRYVCMISGYKFGTKFLEKIEDSGLMPKLTYGASIIGLIIIGAMIPGMVNIKIAGMMGTGDSAVEIQKIIDGIMPYILPLGLTTIIYSLLQRKLKVIYILIGLMALGILGTFLGIFAA
ncbi:MULTISPECIES: PTS system mannose/fructose/sorbose family transporter subunit IID [Clostridium]|jgi:PTS system IID component, Man family (TC 4.A.6)|uniref:Fructoselysine and glucoselysine-specific PTS system IID component n=4 Tax=Clostridium TaxID=1485 RepID=A0A1S8P9V9_CLOBE|nr:MULTISPECIES: PTS system mannose/fructose/sorbose family transporter subunit IID [Clostridium]ABR33142.1 PTS system mannose/fructose/sorbose family IID component [Clostridium beijerinckii NCIMB 8052]AIU03400.1 PTS system mannose/fructose/sorbose family IID component [Clostridium beijerinckii ATCC 35702]ALB47757.1 PTS system mannose/fructose/sorbose family transporter subunit IID [Clostridium beijerinckii NRRL B-598]AVK49990.1 PTS mannose transporter subunit IID [Clostridium sp. MF28]MBE6088